MIKGIVVPCGCVLLWAALPFSGGAQSSFTISTVAGNNTLGFAGDGGTATSAQLGGPFGIWVDSGFNLYIADQFNHRIRKVSGGNINTVAGNGTGGYSGDGKAASAANLNYPLGVVVDSSGNIYIADTGNDVVRLVNPQGNISTFAGQYANSPGYAGDTGPATSALLNGPNGVALDSSGKLYIADTGNNVVRMVAGGNIEPFIGPNNNGGSLGDGGPAGSAYLDHPESLAVDSSGNVYVADTGNNAIREVVAATGNIRTVAGLPPALGVPGGYSGDGGPATQAQLNHPSGVAVDAAGNIYIADTDNFRVRMVTPNGTIFTIAGNGTPGYSGDGGPAANAQLYFPTGVTVDSKGDVYIADDQNNVIRELTPVLSSGPSINSNGVFSLGGFGGFSQVAPGTWIEIHGSNLAVDTRAWTGSDFSTVNGQQVAPTGLEGTTVTIGGQAAYVEYVSSTQINALLPSNLGLGAQQLTVTTAGGTSNAYPLTVNATEPGLYAPSFGKTGNIQYVGAVFTDGATFVGPSAGLPGVTSRPAKPGDTILLFGIGFGPVNPNTPAGQIASQSTTLASPVQVFFGTTQATVSYQGLIPGETGVYQFTVTVPNVPASDQVPISFKQNGVTLPQTLYTAVQAP